MRYFSWITFVITSSLPSSTNNEFPLRPSNASMLRQHWHQGRKSGVSKHEGTCMDLLVQHRTVPCAFLARQQLGQLLGCPRQVPVWMLGLDKGVHAHQLHNSHQVHALGRARMTPWACAEFLGPCEWLEEAEFGDFWLAEVASCGR